jgi:hypothetical protein
MLDYVASTSVYEKKNYKSQKVKNVDFQQKTVLVTRESDPSAVNSLQGNWLNMAEIELSALSKQCLDRRIGTLAKLADEVSALEVARNAIRATVRWKFNKENARWKLKIHYGLHP